ncbi:FAD:protein FMN transferase [Solimonas variicoloris]|uniref:FAD:protein FMN transferase n=1 Tax=Solimonas variicoloris TaxID=254408 RepID=UPI000380414C|nr:FAD:protein FMN transferase [Solimonas variicoloris]
MPDLPPVTARQVFIPLDLASLPEPAGLGATVRRLDGQTMGTRWSVAYVASSPRHDDAVRALAQRELDRVDAQMSTWKAGSDLCRFNAAGGNWQRLPDDFFTVLQAGLALAAATGGAYDPACGALVDLWGFGPAPRRDTPPDAGEIDRARAAAGWARVRLDAATRSAWQAGGVRLDLSSIAKGHGVDLVSAALQAAGFVHHLVEVGGELRGQGCKPDGTPWWVEFERPPPAGALPVALIALHGLAVATSGDYRRAFAHAGRHYGHTIDPRSGWPVAHGLAAVSVVHSRCLQADALATALMVLGPQAGYAFAVQHGIAAAFVERTASGDARERLSPALAALLE